MKKNKGIWLLGTKLTINTGLTNNSLDFPKPPSWIYSLIGKKYSWERKKCFKEFESWIHIKIYYVLNLVPEVEARWVGKTSSKLKQDKTQHVSVNM